MANDVEIVIGARDDATKILRSVTDNVKKNGKEIDSVTTQLTKAALKLAAGWLSVKAASAAFRSARDFLIAGADDFDKAAEAERALATAISLTGDASEAAMMQHVALANSIERQMNIEAEEVLGLMKQASMLGVVEEQLDSVAKSAIGLSKAMGISLDSGLEKVRLATEGNFKSFEKLFPKIKDMATNEEKLAAVIAIAERGLIAQSDAADTATGSTLRAANAWGNMQEAAGGALSELRVLKNEGVVATANALTTILVPAVDSFIDTMGDLDGVSDGVQTFAKQVIIGTTFIETALTNTSAVWTATLDTMELGLVSFANDVAFYLTEQIPANFRNMVDGFKAMAKDAAGFFKSAVTGAEFTPTAQNVGNSKLPSRTMTPREAELMVDIAKNVTSVSGDFMGKSIARILEFERLSIANAEELKRNTRAPGITSAPDDEDDDKKKKNKKKKQDVPELQAVESRLLTRGRGGDPGLLVQQQIKAKIAEQVEVSRDIHYELKKGKVTRMELVK